ncbi:anti-sigma factor family protein [Dictyobacter kobayashii]|uniref:Zinc-finger domain-containing protein n=1 Tax=Dictyobacter kobayashii TaxID=2014872 RepID=A0A402AKZ0_9CHLR|nr:hypothetical protein [Dictyobacter kobayashii]GCE19791.1 hypothetical protein KDK_35910 [Dictyobacter kobayashii]
MSQLDRHLTTEQLSALLDDQISAGEQEESAYRAHLQTCEQCQLEFADLKQTVRLLRALPAPRPPRSFALPTDFSWEPIEAEQEATTRQQETPPPISLPQRRLQQQSRQATTNRSRRATLRLISGLVAVIGIFFMLSTLQLPHMGEAASGTAASNTGTEAPSSHAYGGNQPSTPHASTTNPNKQQGNNTGATGSETQPKPGTVQPATTPATPVNIEPQPLQVLYFFDLTNNAGRLHLGLLLFLIGAISFYIFTQKYRHRWR